MGDTKYLSIESISKENTGGKVTLTASLCSSAGIRADLWYSFDREFDDAVCDDRCDAVVTSGGVSVGQKDYLPVVLESLGAEPVFSGVAQKPGSPMLAAKVEGKLVFCLSGNPFAAAATLEQYVLPALLRAAGRLEKGCILPRTKRTLTTGFSKASKGNRYLRAKASGGTVAIPGEGNAEAHSSGSLSAMIGCNCLVELPAGSGPVKPGEEVEVLSFVY